MADLWVPQGGLGILLWSDLTAQEGGLGLLHYDDGIYDLEDQLYDFGGTNPPGLGDLWVPGESVGPNWVLSPENPAV